MNESGHEKLDNPVWHSLSETHKSISIDYGHVKFYQPSYCSFGGFIEQNIAWQIDEYSKFVNNLFVVGERPLFSNNIVLKKELICLQMVLDKKVKTVTEEKPTKLDDRFAAALFHLVNEVQPGYFKEKTNLMGDYFGIFRAGGLVAVTGERMKMDGFTEVSAVVTHPFYARKGFASQLITHTVNKIFDENKTPYLHVAETNFSAIRLYEKLGFRTRRKMSFWNLEVHAHN